MQIKNFIAETGKPLNVCAQELGISVQSLNKYFIGKRTPSKKTMERIIQWSNGIVQPNDFYQVN